VAVDSILLKGITGRNDILNGIKVGEEYTIKSASSST